MSDSTARLTVEQVKRMAPWNDREIYRFQFRVYLFERRGLARARAEQLADRLALRDQDGDDRRVCPECKHLNFNDPNWYCRQRGGVLLDVLQRCSSFTFETPPQ